MQCTNRNWDLGYEKNSYTLLIVGDMCVDLKSGLCLKVIKQSFKNQMLRLTKYLENKKATIKLILHWPSSYEAQPISVWHFSVIICRFKMVYFKVNKFTIS